MGRVEVPSLNCRYIIRVIFSPPSDPQLPHPVPSRRWEVLVDRHSVTVVTVLFAATLIAQLTIWAITDRNCRHTHAFTEYLQHALWPDPIQDGARHINTHWAHLLKTSLNPGISNLRCCHDYACFGQILRGKAILSNLQFAGKCWGSPHLLSLHWQARPVCGCWLFSLAHPQTTPCKT